MDPDNLVESLGGIASSGDRNRFILEPLAENVHLSRTLDGAPALVFVLSAPYAGQGLRSATLRLDFHAMGEVSVRGKNTRCGLAVLACSNANLLREFAVVAADVRDRVRAEPRSFGSAAAIRELFLRWAELFRPPETPSFEQLVGLWGELHFIAESRDADAAVACWHGPQAGAHDFAASNVCVEVKTSLMGHEHTFGLDQLGRGTDTLLIIRSVHVRKGPADGQSVADLIALVNKRLDSPMALEQKLLLLAFDRASFDQPLLRLEGVRHNRGDLVPRPREVDEHVRDVRFKADLTFVPEIEEPALRDALKRMMTTQAQAAQCAATKPPRRSRSSRS